MPLAVILTAALAAAPKSSAQQADALFSAARALLQSGRAADACPLLEKSQALDPALGTQLNLAECYERVGRRARAFLAYADAFAWAQRSKDKPRQEAANGRMEALKPKLAWLTLSTLTPVREPAVSVNDVALRLGALPRTVPAEPGVVTLTARAPGHLAWMGQLPLEATQAHSFTVPPLVAEGELAADAPRVAEAPAQPSPPPAEPEPAVMPPPLLVPQAPATPVSGAGRGACGSPEPRWPRGGDRPGRRGDGRGRGGLAHSFTTVERLKRQQPGQPDALRPTVTEAQLAALRWMYPASWAAVGAGAVGVTVSAIFLATTGAAPKATVGVVPLPGGQGLLVPVSGRF